MIVHQFNTFPYGGAAAAAKRLHEQINRTTSNVESTFCFHRNEKAPAFGPTYRKIEFGADAKPSLWSPLREQLQKKRRRKAHRLYDLHLDGHDSGGEVFSMAQLPDPTRLDWNDHLADVVHLHWVSFFIDYESFFGSIPDEVPIVWTLHDMNAFTGGCHYSSGCSRFELGCGHCSQIKNSASDDLSDYSFKVKKKALRRKDVHVVTPSQWMCDLAQRSPLWPENTTFQVIHLGFELERLTPVAKTIARAELGIDTDAVLIGFGAEDINNQRKGFHHLLASLKQLNTEQPVECLVFGSGEIPNDPALPKIHHFGFVDTIEQQRLIYSASDLVVVPSREDNQPQIGLEAMACGTPVVGFRAGGIPEYVRPGETGCLAELGNERDLALQISRLVDNGGLRKTLGHQARKVVENEFETVAQTEKYIELYQSLLFMKNYRSRAA